MDAPGCQPDLPADFARWAIPNFVAGLPNPATYLVDTAAGVVRDQVTNLVWQRTPIGPLPQPDAQAACAALVLDGNCDWRLPSRIELISITDYTRSYPALPPGIWPDTMGQDFWSASPELGSTVRAWYVSTTVGIIDTTIKTTALPVRCVRGGYTVPPAHYTADVDTVLDNSTGLVWERVVDPGNFNHAQAMSRCASLPTAGGGWRSPSINELESLVDITEQSPAIHSLTFPQTPATLFWSRNVQVQDMSQGWTVNFDNGSVARALTTALPTRCVR